MSELDVQPWRRLRLYARLLMITAVASLIACFISVVVSVVIFSPVNSLVIALAGSGLSVSWNNTGGVAASTGGGVVQVHLLDGSRRASGAVFERVWSDTGFRKLNIPLYYISLACIFPAMLARKKAIAAAARAGLCHHCGYPRRTGEPVRCPECGHTARL